ncbi:type IV pilus twitching motility protein PilT [Affinibrenneria salicis]|uniref:Type IV pilus twitching motility protein PilT n=1 Tax=Affinibrenneria salicis TaxID=2590031 RepID=A0A5J5FW77_9GAMM|nr:type IV pilus twitching motility protein PilT [Affinibrenneria salicis]KAA8997745.1 type IV pilus twitching motility protein PilT [Affinibrenneria salicis]
MDLDEWVALSVKQNASDLHLCSGHHPVLRIDGELRAEVTLPRLAAARLAQWCARWLTAQQQRRLQREGQLDCALTLADGCRLRAGLFQQRDGLSLALRVIPQSAPSLAELQAPPVLAQLLARPDGLVLACGATGSGKSTTLAALVAELNRGRPRHIITLEDPIEFIHYSAACLIQQREIGLHCQSFAGALRAALREDPDIILLGELRDSDSIRLALSAAETGHLVLATLHTRSASQAVDRLVDVFPADEKAFIRSLLAASLRAVVAQRLLRRPQGGRIALFEILTATPAVSHLIREGKTHQLPGLLQTGGLAGMQTFEQSYRQRCAQGLLSADGDNEPSLRG